MTILRVILVLILTFSISKNTFSENVVIKFKIENEIITNYDIKQEINYLTAFNNKLKNLPKKKITAIATNSIIQEKIKLIHLINIFNVDEENDELNKLLLENLYNNLKLNKYEELKSYLKSHSLNIEEVLYKLKLEFLWNEFIYKNYAKKVNIDKKKLKLKIKKDLNNKMTIDEYYLREILFKLDNNEKFEDKYKMILELIEKDGFENAANIFSISNTSKKGGDLGWIKKTQLNEKLVDKIEKLNLNNITNPIKVGNGFLIIKLENKRIFKEEINLDKELINLVNKETDRQLNQYSIIFFNKLKKSITINEI